MRQLSRHRGIYWFLPGMKNDSTFRISLSLNLYGHLGKNPHVRQFSIRFCKRDDSFFMGESGIIHRSFWMSRRRVGTLSEGREDAPGEISLVAMGRVDVDRKRSHYCGKKP